MPRARVKRVLHRDPITVTLKKVLRNKVTLVAIILIIVGVSMFEFSNNYVDYNVTHNTTYFNGNISNSVQGQMQVSQSSESALVLYFTFPTGDKLHYNLTYTATFTVGGLQKTTHTTVASGTALNNSVVTVQPNHEFARGMILNMTSNTNHLILVHIKSEFNQTYVVHTSKTIGIPGAAIALVGVVLLAYSITAAFEQRSRGNDDRE